MDKIKDAVSSHHWRLARCLLSCTLSITQTFLREKFSRKEFQWKQFHNIHNFLLCLVKTYATNFVGKWIRNKISKINTHDLPKPGDSAIYLLFNTRTKDCYVGETNNLQRRFQSEIRRARECKLAWERKNGKKQFTLGERIMAKIGWEKFLCIPLKNLGKVNPACGKKLRLRLENIYISKLNPSMNSKGKKRSGNKRNFRPLIKFRKNSAKKEKTSNNIHLATYHITNLTRFETQTTNALDLAFAKLRDNNLYFVKRTNKGTDLTNWKALNNHYGTSNTYKNNTLSDIILPIKNKKITKFYIKISHNNDILLTDDFFDRLVRHKYHKQKILKKADPINLLDIWSKAQEKDNTKEKQIFLRHIRPYLRDRVDVSKLRALTINVPYDIRTNLKSVRQVASTIFSATNFGVPTKTYVSKKLRVVYTNNPSIKNILTNSRKWTSAENFPCAGPPYCSEHNHLQKDLSEMPDVPVKISTVNCNYIPHNSSNHCHLNSYLAIAKWCINIINITCPFARNYEAKRGMNILLYDNHARPIWTLPLWKYNTLSEQFRSNSLLPYDEHFIQTLRFTANNYKFNKVNLTAVPSKLVDIFAEYFNITVDYNSTPMHLNKKITKFYSKFKTDKHFGSLGKSDNCPWIYDGICAPAHNDIDITSACTSAILSALMFNKTIVLILPHADKYYSLLKHQTMHKMFEWESNTFKFDSLNHNAQECFFPGKVTIYIVNQKRIVDVNYDVWKTVRIASRQLFSTEPIAYPNKFRHSALIAWHRPKEKGLKTHIKIRNIVNYCKHLMTLLSIPNDRQKRIEDLFLSMNRKNKVPPSNAIFIHEVKSVLEILPKNLVISVKDKNQGSLYVECPFIFKNRINKEIAHCPSFQIAKNVTSNSILDRLRNYYNDFRMYKFGRWTNGTLPYLYIIPKDKDPVNKSRLISSYVNHPLKNVFRNTSRVLTWCFNQIINLKHFTLYKLTDIKGKVRKAQKWLNRNGDNLGLITIQTDVKQMYTNLDHNDIRKAITWLLDTAINKGNKRKRNLNYFIMNKTAPFDIYMSRNSGDNTQYTFTRDDILNIVNVDLNNAYQSRGVATFIQSKGCPMGGILSAIYANVKCAYDEICFTHRIGFKHNRIFGIRQMDDLMLWVVYKKNNSKQLFEALKIKRSILKQGTVYTGGLELEEQDYITVSENHTVHKFAGTVIQCFLGNKLRFSVQIFNKNKESITNNNKQKYPRYTNANSNTANTYKHCTIIGTLFRIFNCSDNDFFLREAIWINYQEFLACEFKTIDYSKALLHMTKYDSYDNNYNWTKTLLWFLDLTKENEKMDEKEKRKLQKLAKFSVERRSMLLGPAIRNSYSEATGVPIQQVL